MFFCKAGKFLAVLGFTIGSIMVLSGIYFFVSPMQAEGLPANDMVNVIEPIKTFDQGIYLLLISTILGILGEIGRNTASTGYGE